MVFDWLLRLANAWRVARWRAAVARRGGRIGRGCTLQPGVRLRARPGAPIILGDGVRLMRGVVLSTVPGGRIQLEDRVYVGEYGVLESAVSVTIGRDTIIAPHAVIADTGEPGADPAPIRVGRDVWFGAGVKVVGGVTIGDQAVLGAGAVAADDVPERGVALGVPARVVRLRGAPPEKGQPDR